VVEVTNDYVCLIETSGAPGQQVFVAFSAIESVAITTSD
jgi:hypothetical protein